MEKVKKILSNPDTLKDVINDITQTVDDGK